MNTNAMNKQISSPVVLVMDDDVQFLKYMSELLQFEGYQLFTALNGDEGLQKYFELEPDLIITDIIMPMKEGIEIIIEIRQQNSKTPIIAMSGANKGFGNKYIDMAKKLGANATFNKPFDVEIFLATVNDLIAKQNDLN